MRYTLVIDQVKSLEWGLNTNQSVLFALLTDLNLWAEDLIINGKIYHFCSRQMIIKEIPLCYSKPDTVYKAFVVLQEKSLIEYIKFGKKDLVRIRDKGKSWNQYNSNSSEHSEINPNNVPQNSEINPTDHNTIHRSLKKEKQLIIKEIFDKTYFPKSQEVENAFKDYLKLRIEKKYTMTHRAVKTLYNKLRELSPSDEKKALDIINMAILKGWQSFYEPKN